MFDEQQNGIAKLDTDSLLGKLHELRLDVGRNERYVNRMQDDIHARNAKLLELRQTELALVGELSARGISR